MPDRLGTIFCFRKKGWGCEKTFYVFSQLLYKITRGASPQNSCRFFISFLSRERKETKQRKETAARLKFSCVPGCSDAQPCQCLRRRRHGTLFSQTVLPTQGCKTHPSTPPPAASSGRGIGKFQTGGPPCGRLSNSIKTAQKRLRKDFIRNPFHKGAKQYLYFMLCLSIISCTKVRAP